MSARCTSFQLCGRGHNPRKNKVLRLGILPIFPKVLIHLPVLFWARLWLFLDRILWIFLTPFWCKLARVFLWIWIWNPSELVHAIVVERCDWPGMWGLLHNKIGARAYFTCVTASPSIPQSLELWRPTTLSRHNPLDCGHGVRSEATFPRHVGRGIPTFHK